MTDTAPQPTAGPPPALADVAEDDRGCWSCEGHVERVNFVLAMLVVAAGNDIEARAVLGVEPPFGPDEWRAAAWAMVRAVEHVWLRPDPDVDDQQLLCDAGHPDAEPFTMVVL